MSIRNAAKALILNNNKILLNKCLNSTGYCVGDIQTNEIYYDLPGGGQNQYETIEEAVKRECFEETGYHVVADRLVALYEEIYMDNELRKHYPDYVHKINFVFLCHVIEGDIKDVTEKDTDQIGSEWIDIKDIGNINLHPIILRNRLQSVLSTEAPIFLGSKRI